MQSLTTYIGARNLIIFRIRYLGCNFISLQKYVMRKEYLGIATRKSLWRIKRFLALHNTSTYTQYA